MRFYLRLIVAVAMTVALGSCDALGGEEPLEFFDFNDTGFIWTSGSLGGADEGNTEGPAYTQPSQVMLSPSRITSADATSRGTIDTTTASDGYVTIAIVNNAHIQLQVSCGGMSYSYNVSGDGTPFTCPLNMGNGQYLFRVMQNTGDNNYVELNSMVVDVQLADEFYPYLRPNAVVRYGSNSDCVVLANDLADGAKNQGDVVQAICNYIVENVKYDSEKAREMTDVHGYLPNPDNTINSRKGICFDYTALAAAMLRSQGIPTRMVTGYILPDYLYHSWISVYINGAWRNVQFNVEPNRWNLMDLTLAADNLSVPAGEGKEYVEIHTY